MTSTMEVRTTNSGLSTSDVARALGIDRSASAAAAVDRDQLNRMAQHLASRPDFLEFVPARWDDPLFWNPTDPTTQRSQLFAVGNTINFRFWRLDSGRMVPAMGTIDGVTYRGAMYMWRSLRRTLDRADLPILDASFLARLSADEFDAIFADDGDVNPLAIARDERIANLRDLGQTLMSSWQGSFYRLVEASRGSLVEFARLSRGIRAFDDQLYKLTMVNAIMHSGSGVYGFVDRPMPAIDYHLVRHALRQELIKPSPRIAAKLKGGLLLEEHEAYELRRVTLSALLDVADLVGIDGEVLDNKYWLNRSNCTDTDPVCLNPELASRCPFLGACAQETSFGLPLELTRYY
jgi:Potential Queuosine, Q, salvage protein family